MTLISNGFHSKFYQKSKEQIQFLHKTFQRLENRKLKKDNIGEYIDDYRVEK